jgi:iron complex transport system substrate-binding protein
MKSIYIAMALALVSILALAGCQASTTILATSTPTAVQQTYTDDLGRSVTMDSIPKRIISLSPSNTEIAFALGLDDRIIGVTSYDNYPEAALSKPQVSEFSNVDVEKIVSLEPDLVLASDIHKNDAVPALEKLGIKVMVLRPGTVDEIFKDIELMGRVTGKTTEAGALVASLQKRVAVVTAKTAGIAASDRPGVLYVTWHDPIWTAGGNTIITDLINKAGGTNIASDLDGYATITLEQVIQRNPQIVIIMSSMGDQDASLNYIKAEPRLQATDALKNNQLYLIDAELFQ